MGIWGSGMHSVFETFAMSNQTGAVPVISTIYISFVRFSASLHYLPDYNVYLDPKNDYYLQRDLLKLTQVIDKYKIKLFYGKVENIKQQVLDLQT